MEYIRVTMWVPDLLYAVQSTFLSHFGQRKFKLQPNKPPNILQQEQKLLLQQ